MKKILHSDYGALALRVFLGLLLIMASIEKIHDPGAFAESVANYRLLPPFAVMGVATVLPWIELLSGLFLLIGILVHGSALLISALMLVFIIAILSALMRGLDILCGCYTLDPSASRIGWSKIIENSGLLLLGIVLVISKARRFSLQRYLTESMAGE